ANPTSFSRNASTVGDSDANGYLSTTEMDLPIRIRQYELADATSVFEAVRESLAALRPWMPWCHPEYSIEESRSWLETQVAAFENRTTFEFAIVSADGHYLGGGGLNQIETANRRSKLGYWVRSSSAVHVLANVGVRQLLY